MPDSIASSPLVAALDPRVDGQVVQDQMQDHVSDGSEPEAADDMPVAPRESAPPA
jgi:hypothetical protein